MNFCTIDVSNFSKTCRLCLSQDNNLIPLSQKTSQTSPISISRQIRATVSLEVSEDDCLPGQICENCHKRINEWYTFKLVCHNANDALQQYIKALQGTLPGDLDPSNEDRSQVPFSILVTEGQDTSNLKQVSIAFKTEPYELERNSANDESEAGFGGLDASSLSSSEMIKHLTCQVCGKLFSRYNNRMAHEKKYHKYENTKLNKEKQLRSKFSGQFVCKICRKRFSRLDFLKTHHLRVHTNHRPFYCECGTGFVRKHDMIWHQSTHVKYTGEGDGPGVSSDKAYECSLCNTPFAKTEKLNAHIQLVHMDSKFQCSQCQNKFFSKEELLWHTKDSDKNLIKLINSSPEEVSSLRSFTCNICNHTFSDIGSCKSHMVRLHSLPATLRSSPCCPQLNLSLSTSSQSDSQMNIQKQEEEMDSDNYYHCPSPSLLEEDDDSEEEEILNDRSTNKSLMEDHSYVSKKRKLEPQLFYCSYCGKEFSSIRGVTAHEKNHTNENAFPCKDCGKVCQTASKLKVHSLTHTNDKPFSCDICQLRFRTSSNLKAHNNRHSSDFGFVCRVCGKDFLSSSGLSRHEILHTGKKPFPCEECEKTFVTSQECKRHMKYHSGEKSHACKYCGKRFYESGHRAVHERSHTNDKTHSCFICSLTFDSNSKLKRHMKSTAHIERSSVNKPQKEVERQVLETNSDDDEVSHRGPNIFDDLEAGDIDDQTDFTHNSRSDFLGEV